ncbi:myelomonocytic growth factor-like [Platysternon megacephalum]|uniref:Myelomonocytic growth factor-like n=1 Tax=Platysternon megacephalum TaxID=55544 RepID=A0A4D9ELY9_9SAUR|nr:myelomonocytic growth factor-like [Platysternon megacephalum]
MEQPGRRHLIKGKERASPDHPVCRLREEMPTSCAAAGCAAVYNKSVNVSFHRYRLWWGRVRPGSLGGSLPPGEAGFVFPPSAF